MKASIQALENIAKEMKKKGIQKISMMGKSDPSTMDKMEAMKDSSEGESEMDEMMAEKKDDDSGVPSSEDEPKEEMASEDSPELTDKLAMIKKLLALKA
jgi:hypothetical protein